MGSEGDGYREVPRLKGRLADNPDLVEQAIARAERAAGVEPVEKHVGGGRWVYTFPRTPPPSPPPDDRPCPGDRRPGDDRRANAKPRLPILGQDGGRTAAKPRLCPSFSPREPGHGEVFGVVAGEPDRPEMIPLERPEPATAEVFERVAPLHPSEVFRIAAPCVEGRCKNFGGGTCHLARSTAASPPRTGRLRRCSIRPRCLWWHQEGPAACLRCPGVVTNNSRSKALRDELGR